MENLHDILQAELKTAIIISIIIIACLIAIPFIFKGTVKKNKDKRTYIALYVIFVLLLLFVILYSTLPLMLDIAQQDYVEYDGEYQVIDTVWLRGKGTITIYLCDSDKTVELKLYDDIELENGDYNGKLLYSKRSKILYISNNDQN